MVITISVAGSVVVAQLQEHPRIPSLRRHFFIGRDLRSSSLLGVFRGGPSQEIVFCPFHNKESIIISIVSNQGQNHYRGLWGAECCSWTAIAAGAGLVVQLQ